MLLTFSKEHFLQQIVRGTKIHTIRQDKHNRWKVGNKIHFWMGNPRNTNCKKKPYPFATGLVSRVEDIRMDFAIPEDWQPDVVYIGENIILRSPEELNDLAVNDGFEDWAKMKLFFNSENQFFGKIIFWKNFDLIPTNP